MAKHESSGIFQKVQKSVSFSCRQITTNICYAMRTCIFVAGLPFNLISAELALHQKNRQGLWTVQLNVFQLCKFRIRLRPLSHIQLSPLGLVHRAHVVSPALRGHRRLARDLACFIVRATLETPVFLFAALGPGGART